MKQWKRELVDAIIAECDRTEGRDPSEILKGTYFYTKFSDVAKKLGYNKILAADIREITYFVHRERPDLHGIRFLKGKKPDCTESLWNTLYFTDVEYDDSDDEDDDEDLYC